MKHSSLLSTLSVFTAIYTGSSVYGAYCGGSPNPNANPNLYEINTAVPQLINQVPNGAAYLYGQPGFEFHLLHIYGTAYEMG